MSLLTSIGIGVPAAYLSESLPECLDCAALRKSIYQLEESDADLTKNLAAARKALLERIRALAMLVEQQRHQERLEFLTNVYRASYDYSVLQDYQYICDDLNLEIRSYYRYNEAMANALKETAKLADYPLLDVVRSFEQYYQQLTVEAQADNARAMSAAQELETVNAITLTLSNMRSRTVCDYAAEDRDVPQLNSAEYITKQQCEETKDRYKQAYTEFEKLMLYTRFLNDQERELDAEIAVRAKEVKVLDTKVQALYTQVQRLQGYMDEMAQVNALLRSLGSK